MFSRQINLKFYRIFSTIRFYLLDLFKTFEVQFTSINLLQRFISHKKRFTFNIFALDLHTSVSRDISASLNSAGFFLNRWSITPAAKLFREPNLRISYINARSWKSLDDTKIRKFNTRYFNFLKNQDAFLVSYTFSLVELFAAYRKPILAINATRYESPYTFARQKFEDLNLLLRETHDDGRLHVVSNNVADKDYLKEITGLDSIHIPSLCDYTSPMAPKNNKWVILCRNKQITRKITSLDYRFHSQEDLYPTGYSFKEFAENRGVILIPYNVSTMRLFELTTAGFPILIPTNRLLKKWAKFPGVMSEISYVQLSNQPCPGWLKNTPADPDWVNFLDWWLERADWHNKDIFPNITLFDSLEELQSMPEIPIPNKDLINHRNNLINQRWFEYLSSFHRICIDSRKLRL